MTEEMTIGQDNAQGAADSAPDGALIFDAGLNDFEDKVIKASMERPVIVDFWAPWCGPCKQLMPMLEQAVQKAGGKVALAKVNLDENQELAGMLRVQSVPTVYAFFQGQPVDGFSGAQPQSQIDAFVDKLTQMAGQAGGQGASLDVEAVMKLGDEALAAGDLQTAQQAYAQILQQDPQNVQAFVGMVRVFIGAGQVDQAQRLIDTAPPDIAADKKFEQAKTALELAQGAGSDMADLSAKIGQNPDDHQARLDLSSALFAAGKREEALDEALEVLRRDRAWNEEAARKQILKFFEAMGPSDPVTMQGRRKLSSLLFS